MSLEHGDLVIRPEILVPLYMYSRLVHIVSALTGSVCCTCFQLLFQLLCFLLLQPCLHHCGRFLYLYQACALISIISDEDRDLQHNGTTPMY